MDQEARAIQAVSNGGKRSPSQVSNVEEKSWYVFAVLARIGRPSTPLELSERSSLFSLAPAEVESFCHIPGSPLSVIEGGLVTCSELPVSLFESLYGKPVLDRRFTHTKDVENETPLASSRKRRGEELVQDDTCSRANKVPKLERTSPIKSCKQPGILSSRQDSLKHPKNSTSFGVVIGDLEGEVDGVGFNDKIQSVGGSGGKMTEDGVALDINKEAKSLPLESIIMRDDTSIISPKKKVPNQSAASLLLAPDCLSVDACLKARGILVKENDLNNIGVSAAGAVDSDTGINAVKTETYFNSINSMQLPVNEDVNYDVKDDSFLTYKRRKGDLSNKQLGFMETECMLCPNCCKMDLETCSRTGKYVQTSGKLDGTQIIKSEENGLKDDHVTLAGDTLTLQVCLSSSDINLVTREKPPIQVKMSDTCIGVDSRQTSVFQNIKCDGARCKQGSPTSKVESPDKKVDTCKVDDQPNIGNACANVEKINTSKQKIKKVGKANADIKDEMDSAVLASKMNGSRPKRIPLFESFTVEEEEGSGGYGTVYKARRKHDGKIFAIKCPLENTPTNYVTNEMKMLERFGGKHCIIKYEGVVKDHDCDCLILQYVEHEKPEVLKREIDLLHLRWYGYCMFKALQALHKEGIIHRDVKPGNFLFSRKSKKGYLIDFNLAMDQLDPNPRKTAKPKMLSRSQKSVAASAVQKPPVFSRRDIPENFRLKALLGAADATNISKKPRHAYIKPSSIAVNLKREEQTAQARPHDSSNNRVRSNPPPDAMDINQKNKLGERAAVKMSGMHLLMSPSKDITSARTPSGGNKREPLPSQGRKELLNLLHEAQQSPQREAPLVPASQRKRVAAPQERVKRDSSKIIYVSPMPLHPNFNTTTAGYNGLPKNKDQKFKRDGPCVGTRGYRAPEVLLRSLHQGCKVDIWSAGVTLLYFMIGKAPFQGTSTEQAIKEIVKVCGKEEIWEMAKLHDRESSLPVELYAATFENMSIEEWCRKNTKRPEFFESIPPSLFDLVNKCLCVNPRQRIDADEALEHEFFAPSREALKRARSSSRESVLTELSVQASNNTS